MDIKPLHLLRLYVLARRMSLKFCCSDVAAQAGVSCEAVRRAERCWHQTNSADLSGLLKWTGLTGTWVQGPLMDALNKKLEADTRRIKREAA